MARTAPPAPPPFLLTTRMKRSQAANEPVSLHGFSPASFLLVFLAPALLPSTHLVSLLGDALGPTSMELVQFLTL